MKEVEILYRVTQGLPAFPGAEPGDHVLWRPHLRYGTLVLAREVPVSRARLLSLHPEAFELLRGPKVEPTERVVSHGRTRSGRRLELVR